MPWAISLSLKIMKVSLGKPQKLMWDSKHSQNKCFSEWRQRSFWSFLPLSSLGKRFLSDSTNERRMGVIERVKKKRFDGWVHQRKRRHWKDMMIDFFFWRVVPDVKRRESGGAQLMTSYIHKEIVKRTIVIIN